MKKTIGKSRSVLLTVLAVGGAVGYVGGVFFPSQKAILSKRTEIREKQKYIATADLEANLSVALEQSCQSAQAAVRQWRQQTGNRRGAAELLAGLSLLAKETEVTIHRLTPRESIEGEILRQQTFDLELSGDFPHVMQFLAGIEQRPEATWVTKLSLTGGGKDGEAVQGALSLVVFVDNRENSG